MKSEIEHRLERIYAAIGETMAADLDEFVPTIDHEPGVLTMSIDMRGKLSDGQLHNLTFSAIHNVASLRDHLRAWAKRNANDPAAVDQTVRDSRELQVIIDLSNRDKHGPLRAGDRGYSRLCPTLVDVRRSLVLAQDPDTGKGASFAFFPFARPSLSLGPGAGFVISGRIVDSSGTDLGDLHEFLNNAVDAWEAVCRTFGLQTSGGSV